MLSSELVSVVICTRNRSESLRKALRSLAEMEVPPGVSWEVLVVDNNSVDGTREVVREFQKCSGLQSRYVFESNVGLSNARNAGIRAAHGGVICFLDDDVCVAPDWLAQIKNGFDQYNPACLGGRVLLKIPSEQPRWWDDWCEIPCGKFDIGEEVRFAGVGCGKVVGIGANISFRRSAFDRYGLFNPELGRRGNALLMGEESEFCQRLQANGERLVYFPHALAYHHPDSSRYTKGYIRRWSFRIGEWYQFTRCFSPASGLAFPDAPLFTYRRGAREFRQAMKAYCRGRVKQAFRHEAEFIQFLGYVCGSVRALLPASGTHLTWTRSLTGPLEGRNS